MAREQVSQGKWTRRDWFAAAGSAGLALLGVGAGRAAAPASAYALHVLAKKPVAYWRLGEASGDVAVDLTKNGHDGAYHGTPALGRPGAIRRDADTSITLDGKTSYVEVPDHADFSQPTSGNGLSVEAWVRPDALEFDGETEDPYVYWLGKGEPRQHEWALRFYSRASKRPNRISAYIFSPDGNLGAGAYFQDKLVAGEWVHVVACYDPGDADSKGQPGVTIYKNGVRRLGPPAPGTLYNDPKWQIKPAHGTAPLRFGTRNLNSFLTGGLDEIAIYPRVLTADEVRDNHLAATKA